MISSFWKEGEIRNQSEPLNPDSFGGKKRTGNILPESPPSTLRVRRKRKIKGDVIESRSYKIKKTKINKRVTKGDDLFFGPIYYPSYSCSSVIRARIFRVPASYHFSMVRMFCTIFGHRNGGDCEGYMIHCHP